MKVPKGTRVVTRKKTYKAGEECPLLDKVKDGESTTVSRKGSKDNTGK